MNENNDTNASSILEAIAGNISDLDIHTNPSMSRDHLLYNSFIYTNTNTILPKFVMPFEEQLQRAILKNNLELCKEILKNCTIADMNSAENYSNKSNKWRYHLCLACENNLIEIAQLLIKVNHKI
jgi:hypothetical protein